MTAIVFLLIAALLSGVGSMILVLRNRRPTSVESGIDEFRREMQALAPPTRTRRGRGSRDRPDRADTQDDQPSDDVPTRSTPPSADSSTPDPAAPARRDAPELRSSPEPADRPSTDQRKPSS